MGLFNHTYKEKIAIKIYNFLYTKENIILNYALNDKTKCDLIIVSKVGIFVINIYDAKGVLSLNSEEDPLWFVMPVKEEKKSFFKSNKSKNNVLSTSKDVKANTIPIDNQIDKASLPNPFETLNKIKDSIISLLKKEDDTFNENVFPVKSIALFDNIKNISNYHIYNLETFKTYLKSLKKQSLRNNKINEYSELIKNNGVH